MELIFYQSDFLKKSCFKPGKTVFVSRTAKQESQIPEIFFIKEKYRRKNVLSGDKFFTKFY